MTDAKQPTEAGSSSEGLAFGVCTKCKKNPRPSNSSWCKACRNEQAAEYRLKTRPRIKREQRVCALDDCEQVYEWKSSHPKSIYCSKSHYMKARHRELHPREPAEVLAAGERRCNKCGKVKSTLDFSPSVVNNAWAQCRACSAEYERVWSKENRQRRSAATRRSKSKRLLREYDAYTDDIDQIIADQGGACACCGQEPGAKGFNIDHDHVTMKFRGLLCGACNTRLHDGADVEWFLQAMRYLGLLDDPAMVALVIDYLRGE